MRIYRMIATFGKLENQTLTLEPGLNVIHRPNEWGKSTWCAFLVNMLYGLETRVKTTKAALADKERYAPWSGSPMAGRIDLNWNGRDITIERSTKGRTPMGEFRAYETQSGLPVPELTAADCGMQLLGVERSVFLRAGFLRLSDLPVTQDDSLRRRLNALVTTGDESNAGDLLAQKLKDLKNKCRYNRSGLLPQAELEQAQLEEKLQELGTLQLQKQKLEQRQQELAQYTAQLENHKAALAYAAAREGQQRIEAAQQRVDQLQQQVARMDQQCRQLPAPEDARQRQTQLQQLQEQQQALQMEEQLLPAPPQEPQIPAHLSQVAPENAVQQAQEHLAQVQRLEGKKKQHSTWIGIYIGISILLLALLALPQLRLMPWPIVLGGTVVAVGIGLLVLCALRTRQFARQIEALYDLYPGLTPARWVPEAAAYAESQRQYAQALQQHQALRGDLDERSSLLQAQLSALCKDQPLSAQLQLCADALAAHQALTDGLREQQQAQSHLQALQAMARQVIVPVQPDELTFSESDTARLLSDAQFEQRQIQLRLGQSQGRMEALGHREALQAQLDALNARIERLNDTYTALDYAQKTLSDAAAQLQRRFAPRISRQAQELFSQLTGGRYDRLTLAEDLSVNAGTREEPTLHSAQWRSEGTVDQLYLALRLAVARELTPQAPLVLDDALVRFDDTRHAAAMELLRKEAENRQIILFTCQSREI